MRVERANLPRDALGLNRRFYRATTRMSHDENHLRTEHPRSVFETGNDLGGDNIAGDPSHKNVTNALVEDEFDGNARIGTRQQSRKRLLFLYRVLLQD